MTWLASVGDDYGKESYVKLPKVLGALQCCVPGIMIVAQTKSVFEEREIVLGKKKCLKVCFGHSVHALLCLFCILQTHRTSRWYMSLGEVY